MLALACAATRTHAQTGNRDSVVADSVMRVARALMDQADSARGIPHPDTTRRPGDTSIPTTIPQRPNDSPTTVQQSSNNRPTVTRLSGLIRDKATGEGIPFATVFIPNTPTGTAADLDGKFELEIPSPPPGDTLRASAMGYMVQQALISRMPDPSGILLELPREAASLAEFVVHAGEDPALVLLKKIIRKKPQNNPDRIDHYRYQAYNKLEVDLQHLSKAQFEKLPVPMIKQFSFIYNNLDSTSENKPFLPFFLTETLSEYYYRRNPKKDREFIVGTQVKGISNESIDRYLGTMQQNINAYDNFLPVFDKQFISPIADNGPFYYKYKIKDTQQAYGQDIYLVQFTPRRPGELTFYGDFWVADSSYALQRISMQVPRDANINYVNNVSLYQEYAPVGDTAWFPVKDKFSSEFSLPYSTRLPGFIGRKSTTYQDIHLNDDTTLTVLNDKKLRDPIIVADDAREKGRDFWDNTRPEGLSKNERAIYNMIDTLQSLPEFQRFKTVITTLATGLVTIGPIEIGPIYNFYSSNPVEGPRYQMAFGTTPKLFKDAYLNGYAAYGTKDEEWKYSASLLYLFDRKPRTYFYARHTHDISRNAPNSDGDVLPSNIFSTIGRRPNIPWKLAKQDVSRVEFYHEYPSGFSHMLFAQRRRFWAYDPLPDQGIFNADNPAPGSDPTPSATGTEVGVRLRFAYHEDFLEGNYLRYSLGSGYPITELRLAAGIKGFLGGQYAYQRATLSVNDVLRIAPFGTLSYNFFAGRIWGTLPYPLLEIHPGNEFYYYNPRAFNMMLNYEFLSDKWAGFMIEHNIGGGIFNYIPYLKKAKLRQFWTAKGIVGSASDANEKLNLNKGYAFRTLEGSPYIELGTGINNILQLFRVDFVWRVTPRPDPTEKKDRYFGIFGSVEFKF